jgi:hypothetical protein
MQPFKITQHIDGELGVEVNRYNTLYMENSSWFYNQSASEELPASDCFAGLARDAN